MKLLTRLAPTLFLASASLACVDTVPEGLGPAPSGVGPTVRFDVASTPWPDVPFPNDVLTFADPTSRTGRRVNLALGAATRLERRFRDDIGTLEGWGTSSPVTVSFARSAATGEGEPAIDLVDVAARMAGDDHDPANDPLYVIDLETGLPALLDVGSGAYPEGTAEATETSWYERATDTLVARPLVPLEEKRTYAVVLTDRLRSPRGEVVRSPFATVHHPAQRVATERVEAILRDPALAGVYGDLAGTGLARVTFTWSFTTQPTHDDLRLLRAGLHGQGPFARFARDFPPRLRARPLVGPKGYGEALPTGWQDASVVCKARSTRPYLVPLTDPSIRGAVRTMLERLYELTPGQSAALDASLDAIDHLVLGSFASPYLLGEPGVVDTSRHFSVDFEAGQGEVRQDDVDFLLVVPKRTATRAQPFPVALYAHAEGRSPAEALLHAGAYAAEGVATMALAAPEHGLDLPADVAAGLAGTLADACALPLLGTFLDGRAHDGALGSPARGFQVLTTHPFHARDVARQAALEAMQAIRGLRGFDGRRGDQDYDASGTTDVAGDFDADGVVDVGGPGVPYLTVGTSWGGSVAAMVGAVEPSVVAAVPVASGGGLAMDVAFRGKSAEGAQLLGPIVVATPASGRADTTCPADARSVRLVVAGGAADRELEVACLPAAQLDAGRTIVVTNLTSGALRCARTGDDGRFAIPIPTSRGDRLDVQVYDAPDAVASFSACAPRADAPVGRRIQKFEVASATFAAGADLIAPEDGLGLRRSSPDLRRHRDLVQAAFDPGDAVNYAPFYSVRRLYDERGLPAAPRALLATVVAGDPVVPVAAGAAFARAAGALPFLPPRALASMPAYADYVTPLALYDALGGRTPERVLVEGRVLEGGGAGASGPACSANTRTDLVCAAAVTPSPAACSDARLDVDAVSGGFPWDAPRLPVPLRLGRVAGADVHAPGGIEATWEPRLRGAPGAADASAWVPHAPIVGFHVAYADPLGGHAWTTGDVCRAWDFARYEDALVARFLASGGSDLVYLSRPTTQQCLASGTCDAPP